MPMTSICLPKRRRALLATLAALLLGLADLMACAPHSHLWIDSDTAPNAPLAIHAAATSCALCDWLDAPGTVAPAVTFALFFVVWFLATAGETAVPVRNRRLPRFSARAPPLSFA